MAAPTVNRVTMQIKPLLLRTYRTSGHISWVKSVCTYSKSVCSINKSKVTVGTADSQGIFLRKSGGPGTSIIAQLHRRSFSDETRGLSDQQLKKKIEALTDEFMEARDLLADARESKGTVYFSDDLSDAKEAVKGTLDAYNDLLSQLDSQQTQHVLRSIGLKMQELQAQLKMLEDELLE